MGYLHDILEQVKALGVNDTDTLLVHTSIKGLNAENLQASKIIEALMRAVSNGTLLMPALSYLNVTEQQPVFDCNKTKSCIGIVPELFRTQYATDRSIHPTHSVCAVGKDANAITMQHRLDNTPVGPNSPFRLLAEQNGKILMLGCGLLPNTFMHGVEEAANVGYALSKDMISYTINDTKQTYSKGYYPHSFKELVQRYDRLEALLSADEIKKGEVLFGTAYLIDAKAAMNKGIEAIEAQEKFFVD